MSFYSYKNCNQDCCPGPIKGECRGLREKVCVQVKKVYDSCMQQEQLDKVCVTVSDMIPVCECECNQPFTPPICFESCRSSSYTGTIRNLVIDRICDRPGFARVRCAVDIPIDILFTDSCCREGIGHGVITVSKDVLLCIPDESIVPFTMESLVSAICVSGRYCGNNTFELTICVTVILKVLAEVEMLIPSFGFCSVPPCEEFAENVCGERGASFFRPCGRIDARLAQRAAPSAYKKWPASMAIKLAGFGRAPSGWPASSPRSTGLLAQAMRTTVRRLRSTAWAVVAHLAATAG